MHGRLCYATGMEVPFSKYEGLGNDFILIETPAVPLPAIRAHARALCDRHRGVGADGILLVARGPRGGMQVINADGSEPEMCGNGLRCVALHLQRTGAERDSIFEVDTAAGPHRCEVLSDGAETQVRVQMRAPSLQPTDIGVEAGEPLRDAALPVGDHGELHVTAVSTGNPHAVTFDEVGERRLVLGPALSTHPRFAHGANAGFARVVGPDQIELFVHERGAGWTQACGTGACACAVAAVETGRADRGRELRVDLPGGPLRITVGLPAEPIAMTGPARHVYEGRIEVG